MKRNVYSTAVFTWGRPLCTQISPGHGRLQQPFSVSQKTTDTGLPDDEDRIPLRSIVLTKYRSVTDRQTDGRTDIWVCLSAFKAGLHKKDTE